MIPTPEEQPTVSVETMAPWFGLSRSAAYEAVRRGEIPSLRFGRSLRIPTAAARRLLGIDPEPESDPPTATVVPLRRETGG
jgi:excisionase family DNA binding protein